MHLAKPQLDVGLMVRQLDPMLAFWQGEVGLRFEQLLPTGGGNQQHRHAIHGSIVKLNASRDPQPHAPASGYRELWIARPGQRDRALADPDGNRLRLVAPGERGVVGIAMRVGVRDPDRHVAFYRDALGLEADAPGVFVCGNSRLFVEADPAAPEDASIRGTGYRYLTLQVHDCDAETDRALRGGATLGAPPRTHGDVARFSMVRDPDGNWIEISQRRSLTGALPPDSGDARR
jgi:catechol 2,3-dioxygenase-like lactoylglutathione lyase family enzyme